LTRSVDKNNVTILIGKPIAELRRLQDLIAKQIEKAYRDRNTEALEELQVRQTEVIEAIVKKEF
jgi:uncharacterized membrane protein (DUF106 family)